MNAYWLGQTVTLVHRNHDGSVRETHVEAEHSCFVGADSLTAEQRLRLERNTLVLSVREEPGRWLRVCLQDRDACASFCEACERSGIATFEGCVSPVVRLMADRALTVARPRVGYFDLEADSRVPFSQKERARILSWALVGEDGAERSAVLAADTDRRERDLLAELIEAFGDYDLLCAWNGDRYDFPLLQARAGMHRLVGGRVNLKRWLWLDQLEQFRRMNASSAKSGDEKQSLALEAVAQSVLGYGKVDFDASKTWEAWAAGGESRALLLEYNQQDARLMPAIEARTGHVEILITIAQSCGMFPDSRGTNPGTQVESFLQRLATERGHKFPTRLRSRSAVVQQFKGAYVMEPKASGIARNVHVADFARLYPSIILSWNMSPETVLPQGATKVGAFSPLTDVSFRTEVQGILPAAVDELLKLREKWRKVRATLAPGTPEALDAERRSNGYKIVGNSFYGVIGQSVSRFFDRRVAESVAQCGVWLIRETIAAAEERGFEVVYGDTDSLYVRGCDRGAFAEFVRWCNEELYPELLEEVGARENRIELEYEKAYDRIIFCTGKRYVGSYAHYKGKAATAESEPEIKGLEYKRGDTLRVVRRFQEEVVHVLLGYRCVPAESPKDLEAVVAKWRERVLAGELLVEDVMLSKRLSRELHQYASRRKKDGTDSRQLPHIELARELGERGRDVGEGAKIDYVVVGPREKPQRVVAVEDWDGEMDRAGLWEKYVAPPTMRLLEAAFPGHDWSAWEKAPP